MLHDIFNRAITKSIRAQRLINLEIPVLVQSLKSGNVKLGYYLDGRQFKCCLSGAANPQSQLDLISHPILVVGSVSMQS